MKYSLLVILFIILFALKVAGVTAMSWWLVFTPLFIQAGIWIIFFLLFVVAYLASER